MPVRLSIIVASRGRPQSLARCLTALTLQDHPQIEVILVADPAGLAVRPDLALKRVGFDRPNLAQARNLGLMQAAGEVVGFIDDDAVAEPGWAAALGAALADTRAIAATGATLGPDGIRWQARAEWLDADGPRPLADHRARLWFPQNGGTLSTLGTNCAFRRGALLAVGGFDPAFAFHLDESDLNLRLAARFPQGPTAFVPGARVVHLAAAGTSRKHGAPHDLTMIGRSEAIFARRHGASPGWPARLRSRQRARLLRAMLAGRLDPLHLRRVLASLDKGLAEAPACDKMPPWPDEMQVSPPEFTAILPLGGHGGRHRVLFGWHWQRAELRARAARAVAQGDRVSLMLWSPGALPHREEFTNGGWWERKGGLWGAGRAGDPPIIARPRARRERELADHWHQSRDRTAASAAFCPSGLAARHEIGETGKTVAMASDANNPTS